MIKLVLHLICLASFLLISYSTAQEDPVGDLVWRQGISSDEYTCTKETFSGFSLDSNNCNELRDDELNSEKISIHLNSDDQRQIDPGSLLYSSFTRKKEFKFEDWGSYEVIDFLGEQYFASNQGRNQDFSDEDTNLLERGLLFKVLTDIKGDFQANSGGFLPPLEEGYSIKVTDIRDNDANDGQYKEATLVLMNGDREIKGEHIQERDIDSKSIRRSTIVFNINYKGIDIPFIMIHLKDIHMDDEADWILVDGIFQLSDKPIKNIEASNKFGLLSVYDYDGSKILMKNHGGITLGKGNNKTIADNIGLRIADNDTLRFYPYKSNLDSVRSNVVDPREFSRFSWNPYRFVGFYYDMDDDVGSECLILRLTDAQDSKMRIEKNAAEYSSKPGAKKFAYRNWGNYSVIGFLGEPYFAGYCRDEPTESSIIYEKSDIKSLLNDGKLLKVLKDQSERINVSRGESILLEEGFELKIENIDIPAGNKVYATLYKDGKAIPKSDKVMSPSTDDSKAIDRTFTYEREMPGYDDNHNRIVTIAISFLNAFRDENGTEVATVDGIWQISDELKQIAENDVIDDMKVNSVNENGILLKNLKSILLDDDSQIRLLGPFFLNVSCKDDYKLYLSRRMAP